MNKKAFRVIAALVVSLGMGMAVSGCASPSVVPIEVTDTTYIIDVRSADKFKVSHVEGAYNIDFNSPTVNSTIQGLSRSRTYILYGDDEAQIKEAYNIMTEAGFIDVKHSGSMEYVSEATGLPIVNG